MKNRKNLPIAALRAFEAAARHGQLTAAAEELASTALELIRHAEGVEKRIAFFRVAKRAEPPSPGA